MKILIVRFSSIGDIVLTTPVIRCLHQQLPNAEIHYLTKPQFKSILIHHPQLKKIHTLTDDWKEMITHLKAENFDFIVDLHHNLRTRRLKFDLKKTNKSFPKLNIQKWLKVQLGIDLLPKQHIAHRYLKAVPDKNIQYDNKGLDYFISDMDIAFAKEKTAEFSNPKYVLWAIGGQHFTKKFPLKKIVDVIKVLKVPVVLSGGKEDTLAAEEIISQLPEQEVYNFCGNCSLNQSAAMVKHANVVVSNDTGLMHIAAAFKRKIISIWGNTIPEFGMYPLLPQGDYFNRIIEEAGVGCRPCSKIGFDQCPKGHFNCMQQIESNRVLQNINDALAFTNPTLAV